MPYRQSRRSDCAIVRLTTSLTDRSTSTGTHDNPGISFSLRQLYLERWFAETRAHFHVLFHYSVSLGGSPRLADITNSLDRRTDRVTFTIRYEPERQG